ncbi:MAG: oligoendopeptidase F [Candidatus Deianiraeaceae bacterium]|jgi:oligoendopeptidase F
MEVLPSWNLSSLFVSPDDCTKAMVVLKKNVMQFTGQYKGKIANTEILTNAVVSYENIVDGMHRVGTYAYLRYITNMNDHERKKLYHSANEVLSVLAAEMAFFVIAINDLSDEVVFDQKIDKYKTFFENIRLYKPYELSEEVEQVMIKKSITSSNAWSNFFDETMAKLRFILDGKELNSSQIFNLLSDKDSKVREQSANVISNTLNENIQTFAFITNTLAKDKSLEDKMRGFNEPISSRNVSNLIEDDIVYSLISSVKKSYKSTAHKYYKLKAKILGKEKLEYWDRNAPMPFNANIEYSYDEAKNITLEAYEEFCPRMSRIGKAFFDKNWIDASVREFKDSGAFSHPASTSANPFIMLNFLGKTRDVATMAHELGHGVHQFLAKKQGALLCQTPLTLAETASVFGEQLVFQKMLKNTTSREGRLEMLSSKIEDMINTSVRQVAFCDFEIKVHNKRQEGNLSAEEICNIWMEVQKESLGEAFNYNKEYGCYWSYIPHFIHSPFYVYAYAFGDILVNSLYSIYLEGSVDNFEDKYLTMLETGGALRHKDLLNPFGIDISKEDFWQNGMSVLEGMIEDFEEEYIKVGR